MMDRADQGLYLYRELIYVMGNYGIWKYSMILRVYPLSDDEIMVELGLINIVLESKSGIRASHKIVCSPGSLTAR
jgi:hypothetical protein